MRRGQTWYRSVTVGVVTSLIGSVASCVPSPVTLDGARRAVIGEWTAAAVQPGVEIEPGYWQYLRFEPDGKVLECTAMGGSDAWRNCQHERYEVISDRYADTGKDFFRIRISNASLGWSAVVYIMDGNRILQRITQDGGISYLRSVDFRRGNRHPHAPTPRDS